MFLPIGQMLELVAEHPDNEHWWEVRNEDGETGFVPASYVLIKEEQVGRQFMLPMHWCYTCASH